MSQEKISCLISAQCRKQHISIRHRPAKNGRRKEVSTMVVAKVQDKAGAWRAWLGVSLDHIEQDVKSDSSFILSTLQPITFAEVKGMEWFAAALNAIRKLEQQHGAQVPFMPGKSSHFLGKLKAA